MNRLPVDRMPVQIHCHVVLGDYFLADVVDLHSYVLRAIEQDHEVEVGDIHCDELGVFCRHNTNEQHLGH